MIRVQHLFALPFFALAFMACVPPSQKPVIDHANHRSSMQKPAIENKSSKNFSSLKPERNDVQNGSISLISFESFFALQQSGKTLIYDARPAFYYHVGHIPGAISLPRNSKEKAIALQETKIKQSIAKGNVTVIYCTGPTCQDARALANRLSSFGYPVSIFSGGWQAWNEAEMPTE